MFAVALLAVNAFLSTFAGTWNCVVNEGGPVPVPATTWTIAAAPESTWTIVRWRARRTGGIAFVGYLEPERQWIYEDFHGDGTFATSTSAGPQGGTWTWSATYTTPERVQHGAIQWRREGDVLHQGFGRLLGSSFREASHVTCRPAASRPTAR